MKERRRIKEFQRWAGGRAGERPDLAQKNNPDHPSRSGRRPLSTEREMRLGDQLDAGAFFVTNMSRKGIVSLLLKYEYENRYFSVTSLESESKFAHYESHRQLLFCVTCLFGAFLPRRSCTSLRHRQGPSASVLSLSLAFFGGMHDGAIKVSRRRIRQSPPPPHAIFRGR